MKQTAMIINMINNNYKQQKIQEIRLLMNDEEVLDEADEILGDRKIIYKSCGQWKLAREYRNKK